jgi:hypothetical protein
MQSVILHGKIGNDGQLGVGVVGGVEFVLGKEDYITL